MADQSTIAIGDVLDGKYEITDILGEGGMGVVYLALHKRLQRMVALKTLRGEYASNAGLIERFEREARAASAIGHPNIVQVYDAGGEPGGVPYLVMESLEGQSLDELLEEKKSIELPRAIDICCQVLAGLSAAHAAGILHRDLKPDNIFVSKDRDGHDVVKILDFGISKFLDAADPKLAGVSGRTQAGTLLGTPRYMSPEQACGQPDLDPRADLWALVCVFYKCLTGKTPFNGENYQQLLAAVLQGQYISLQEHRPDLPLEVNAVVQKGLEVERENRFSDATSLSVALTSIPTDQNFPRAETMDEDDRATMQAKAPTDPKMLAAFDNLADRFLEQEREDALDLAETQARPTPAPSEPVATPSADLFAPPGASDEVSLALDVEPTPRSRMAPEPHTPAPGGGPPRKRRHSQYVTRKEASGLPALIAKLFVAILVVGGAGVGYRYYKLGYLIPPKKPPPATLAIGVQPESAQVFLNKEATEERKLSLPPGETYTLRIEAPGRLKMATTFEAQSGSSLGVSAVLAHQFLSIEPGVVAAAEEVKGEVPERASIDAARAKLAAFGDCGERLSAAITDSIDEKRLEKELEPLPRALTDECGLTLDLAVESAPVMEALDKASKDLRTSVAEHSRGIAEYEKSKGASKKIMRARKEAFRKALREAKKSASQWRIAMSQMQARWLALEALRVQADEGDGLHSQVRSLAVSSDAWMRTHLAGKPADKERSAMADSYRSVTAAAAKAPGTYAHTGASAYLNALKPLIEKKPGDDALFWHNQAVFLFNKIRLPIETD